MDFYEAFFLSSLLCATASYIVFGAHVCGTNREMYTFEELALSSTKLLDSILLALSH